MLSVWQTKLKGFQFKDYFEITSEDMKEYPKLTLILYL